MREISLGNARPLLSDRTGARPLLSARGEAERAYSSVADEVHLRDYWNILVKRRRLLGLISLMVLMIGTYITVTATSMYTATAVLKIEPQNPSVTGLGEMLGLSAGGSKYDYYETQFELLQGRALAAVIIRDLNLKSDKIFTSTKIITANAVSRLTGWTVGSLESWIQHVIDLFQERPKRRTLGTANTTKSDTGNNDVSPSLIGHYNRFLSVKPVKNTRLVEIRFSTPSPDLSQKLANAHAKGFIQMSLQDRFELTKQARDFLDGKNLELKAKLEKSEDALNQFRQNHGVVSMEKGENIVVERLVELNKELTSARAKRIEAESLFRVVENKSPDNLAQLMNQGLIPTLRSTLLSLGAEKVKLSTVFKPNHPRIIELDQQIGEARRSLNTEISNTVRAIQGSYATARAKEDALQAEADRQQKAALNLKEVGVEYAVLQEEVNVNRSLYESVLKRLNETNVSNDLAASNIQIIETAERPNAPSSPNIPLNIVLSGLLGLFLGAAFVFVMEYLDSSVSTPELVWRAAGLSTFGVVPDLNSLKPHMLAYGRRLLSQAPFLRLPAPPDPPSDLIVAHHPLSIVTESYRTIRTALLFSQAEQPPKVVLLTSPSPNEGKTVTTLNLAVALAQDGYKVLVVDADFRKGSCHTRLELKNYRGLSNILTGHLALQEGIQPTAVDGLSFLSRGVCPPNPGELLGSSKMREILNYLRDSYNFILIDSPPAIAVSDATILSVMSDGVLLVLHGKKTTAASLRQVVQRLDSVRAPILGVVLNGIDVDNPDYAYYRHYYGSNYGAVEENKNGNHKIRLDTGNGFEPREPESSEGDLSTVIEEGNHDHDTVDSESGFEPAALTEFAKSGSAGETVSREFLDHVTARLAEDVGPMALFIVKEHISSLGESMDTFPKSRLNELLRRVSGEILDNDIRQKFRRTIKQELESL